jgi:hypothetical protein
MEKFYKTIFDLSKLPTKLFLLFSLVSGFILFVEQPLLREKLFLDILKKEYGWILGGLFILCSGLVVVNFSTYIFTVISRKIKMKRAERKFTLKIKTLDRFEKSVLREFILNQKKSIDLPMDDPTVAKLLHEGILEINRQFKGGSLVFGYKVSMSINELVIEHLKFQDLDLSDPPTKNEIEFVSKNRPPWINQY